MKKILFRKLFFDYMGFFIVALLSSSIIMWVFQAVNFLDIMIEDGRDYIVYISYSLLNFPKIFSKLFPFILFFSLFYVTIKYENNNELMIFWNFGINKIQLINFILKISIFLTIIQMLLTSVIVPKTQDSARSFLRSSTVNFLGNFVKPQKFNDTIKGVTIYSEKKDVNGNLFNLYLKKEIDENNIQITYAKKGIFKYSGDIPILVLFDGATITQKNDAITNFTFAKSDFPISNFKSNTTTYRKTQEISTINIFKCIFQIYKNQKEINKKFKTSIQNCSIKNFSNIFKELYKRVVIPFYIPILMIVPFLLIISSKESSNYSRLKLFSFMIGVIFIIFSETTLRLISEKIITNYLISLIPFIALTAIYIFLFNKFTKNKIT